MKPEQIICQIKELCVSVTEQNYDNALRRGHEYLSVLKDMGLSWEQVYQPLNDYCRYLDDGMIRDWVADLLDFVVGWCSPQWDIWRSDRKHP